jgi:alpha-D-xyloside xylohydrolase
VRLPRLLIAGLACVLLVVGPKGSSASAGPVTWRTHSAPFSLQVLSGDRVLTALGGTQAPLTYTTTTGATHSAVAVTSAHSSGRSTTYTLRTDEPGRKITVVASREATDVRLRVSVVPAKNVAALGVDFTASTRDHFLGTGERLRWVDMRSTVVPLKARNQCGSNSPSPFVASSSGFGVWSSSTAVGRIGFPGRADDSNFACDIGGTSCAVGPPVASVRFCFKAADVSFEVAAGTPAAVVSRHAKAVGLPRMPWLQQFALIKWRDVVTGPGELLDDIHELRSRNLPIGWVILDNPWESGAFQSGCYGSLQFDPHVYPDPKGLISSIHALGVHFMLWISPQLARGSCAPPQYPDGWLTGDDHTYVRDLTNPAELADFEQRLKALVALGVDGFKGDRADEVNLEPDRLAGGSGVQLQDEYPLLYARAATAALRSAHGSDFATIFRSFVPGSSAVLPGVLGPDQPQTFDGLAGSIRSAQTAGVSGDPVWGSDIGGYEGGATLTSNLFVRWAQFAALTPIFEVGGAGLNATFWDLGAPAVDGLRAAATLHYELVPYLYELAREASKSGSPIVRPLGLGWPGDPRAWSHDLEFTVGNALLAAPLTSDAATSQVYLPAGTWIDFFTGRRYTGGHTITRTSGPDDFPLYVRAGSAVADNFRTPSLWPTAWSPDDLLRADRQGWLVAPEPGATVTARDRASLLTARTAADGSVDVRVTGALAQEQLRILSPRTLCGSGAHLRITHDASATYVAVDSAPHTMEIVLRPCS